MARSFRKRLILPNAEGCESEKFWKRQASKRIRSLVRHQLRQILREEKDSFLHPHRYDGGNHYWWGKDGKSYISTTVVEKGVKIYKDFNRYFYRLWRK